MTIKIKNIKDKLGNKIYPISSIHAIYDKQGNSVDDLLNNIKQIYPTKEEVTEEIQNASLGQEIDLSSYLTKNEASSVYQ